MIDSNPLETIDDPVAGLLGGADEVGEARADLGPVDGLGHDRVVVAPDRRELGGDHLAERHRPLLEVALGRRPLARARRSGTSRPACRAR